MQYDMYQKTIFKDLIRYDTDVGDISQYFDDRLSTNWHLNIYIINSWNKISPVEQGKE